VWCVCRTEALLVKASVRLSLPGFGAGGALPTAALDARLQGKAAGAERPTYQVEYRGVFCDAGRAIAGPSLRAAIDALA
jgi:hypothetical protein